MLLVGEADIGLVVDAESLVGLELEIGLSHGLGAKVNAAEREIVRAARCAAGAEARIELAHVEIAVTATVSIAGRWGTWWRGAWRRWGAWRRGSWWRPGWGRTGWGRTTSISIAVSVPVSVPVPVPVSIAIAVPVPVPVAIAVSVPVAIAVAIAVSVAIAVPVPIAVPIPVVLGERCLSE